MCYLAQWVRQRLPVGRAISSPVGQPHYRRCLAYAACKDCMRMTGGYDMSYNVKKMEPCKRCDTPTTRRERNTRDALCITCATAKAIEQQQQLAQHSGPHYDAWLNSMAKFLRRQGTATPPSYTNGQPASRDT